MSNPNFDAVLSTTLKNYRAKLADNITGHQALLWKLKDRGFYEEKAGGATLVEPLMYGQNPNVASYELHDPLTINPYDGLTSAEYNWKQVAGTFLIAGIEEFKNASKEKVIDLLTAKAKQLEISMKIAVNAMLFGDGSGNGGKDISGISLYAENGTAWSTVGGIDSSLAGNAYWRNYWKNMAGADWTLDTIRNIYNSVNRNGEMMDLIISDQIEYEQFEKLTEEKNVIQRTDTKLADAGFMNYLYRQVPWTFDQDCPAASVYFLMSDYLKFIVGKGRNFKISPLMEREGYDDKLSVVTLYAQLVCSNRARQGVMDGIVHA